MLPPDFPNFQVVSAQRIGPDMNRVRWAVQPTAWAFSDLSFLIFRSFSPAGPWDQIAEVEAGLWSHADSEAFGAGTYREPYYLVRIASKSGKGYRDSRATRVDHDPDHIAIELVRKKLLSMEHKNGVQTAVLLRRRLGPNCSRCYNEQQQEAGDANCPECLGTGFTGGYYSPVFVPMIASIPDKLIQHGSVDVAVGQVAWEAANWPTLDEGDVIVDRQMNIRYRVDHVRATSHRGHLISQFLTMTRCDDRDVIYTISIPPPENAAAGRSYDSLDRQKPRNIHATASSIDF
ncbi:MAG TPA: hypothetical protein VLH09_13420 [Bryobacteraceae bacterium]|nr:hypothetical protein [Bryobacteraceae bacterium]